jgi:hypothetical protein
MALVPTTSGSGDLRSDDQIPTFGHDIYDQDGAPCHRDRQALKYLEERDRALQDCPPNSPDLSPIETYLAVLKMAVSLQKPTTVDTLKTALERARDFKYRSIVQFMSSRAHHVFGPRGTKHISRSMAAP